MIVAFVGRSRVDHPQVALQVLALVWGFVAVSVVATVLTVVREVWLAPRDRRLDALDKAGEAFAARLREAEVKLVALQERHEAGAGRLDEVSDALHKMGERFDALATMLGEIRTDVAILLRRTLHGGTPTSGQR